MATSIHWAREDSGLEAEASGTPATAALRHPLPPAQAHLAAGQADDTLTPIQVLATVACAERGGVSTHLPSSPTMGDTLPLPTHARGGTHGR